jgi:hypothetical protein
MLSASVTDIALASFMTSDGTEVGKRACFDWCAPLAVCSFHTLASCSSRSREASLTNAGQRRRCTYVILPPISLQTRTLGTLANRLGSAKNLFPFWVAPPAASNRTTGNRLCEIWNRASCGLKDDSATFNKCERFLLVHNASSVLSSA